MKNLLHQSLTPERYGPAEVGQALQSLYKKIFFDLSSSSVANLVIGANGFFTREDDALQKLHSISVGDVYCNPPGGKLKNRSMQQLFWDGVLQAWLDGRIRSAVFLNFNLNAGPALCPGIVDFPRVYTSKEATLPCVTGSGRIRFLARKTEIQAVIQAESQKTTDPMKLAALHKKSASLEQLPVVLKGTDLVQERSPTNPGCFIFLPPILWGGPEPTIEEFREQFEPFGSYCRGNKFG